jgi:hypothetical protein
MEEKKIIRKDDNHWAGRNDMKDYVYVSGADFGLIRHIPTGLEMDISRHLKISAQSGHRAFDFGKNLLQPEWEVTLLVMVREAGGGSDESIGARTQSLFS